MDTASIALAAVATQATQTRAALGVEMMKMNAASDRAVVDLLSQAAAAGRQFLAQPAPGTGTVIDVVA